MARQTSSPRQTLTWRQIFIFVGIVALLIFALMYARNVLRYRELQNQLQAMDANIASVKMEKEEINRAFDESISPAVVEDFVRQALNWVRPGDQVVVMVGEGAPSLPKQPGASPGQRASADEESPKANWQLWWDALMGDSAPEQ